MAVLCCSYGGGVFRLVLLILAAAATKSVADKQPSPVGLDSRSQVPRGGGISETGPVGLDSLPSGVKSESQLLVPSNIPRSPTCSSRNANVTDLFSKIAFDTCPVGFYCNDCNNCACRNSPSNIVRCDPGFKFSILDCYCATLDEENDFIDVGACIFNCANTTRNHADLVYHRITNESSSLNNATCKKEFNRNGTLCGTCLANHYPLAYSFNMTCVPCPHAHWNWLWYIMAAYLPLTLFYFIIIFFKINVVTSHLHPIVLYSQCSSFTASSQFFFLAVQNKPILSVWVKIILSFYGIWNLDFFRPYYNGLCLGIGVLPTLALDYAIAVYPLLLMVVSYLLIALHDRNYRVVTIPWKPFQRLFFLFRRNWDIRTSVIDSYATFFLLSNVKFLSVTFDLLVPTKVYHLYGEYYNHTWALYYAGDIEYFGKAHLPYAILAIFLSSVFVIFPIIVLALYPFRFFQKFLNLFPFRWYILHTFVDSLQGCYKDGTEPGTWDCRWFASVYLLFRFILFLCYGLTLSSVYYPLGGLFVLLLILLIVLIHPYKASYARHTSTNVSFLLLYAMFYFGSIGVNVAGIKSARFVRYFHGLCIFISLLPLVYTFILVFFWFYLHRKFGLALAHRASAWRHGYNLLGVDNGEGREAEGEFGDRMMNPGPYRVNSTTYLPSCHSAVPSDGTN